jgi:hypothetical protein
MLNQAKSVNPGHIEGCFPFTIRNAHYVLKADFVSGRKIAKLHSSCATWAMTGEIKSIE